MLEYWIDVSNFPDYQVSNHGRVKNKKTDKILKPYPTRGYLRIGLYDETGRKCKLVHRLVAEAFIPNPKNKPAVNHINGCKTDNNVTNLEWSTASENLYHAHNNGLRPKLDNQGEKNGFAKLTEAQVIHIKQLLADGKLTQKAIASHFNVSRETISNIKNGRRWSHVLSMS